MPYKRQSYLAMALDPIHVGTGEFQLGRVDNTIVREAGTNLPKIPGSSIAGVTRAYTAMQETGKYLAADGKSCAGKGGDDGANHCCRADCPVCTTFGFSKKGASFQGLAQFSDARILFFPVYSSLGPVWVTSPSALEDAAFPELTPYSWSVWDGKLTNGANNHALILRANPPDHINLGWLYLPKYTENPPLNTGASAFAPLVAPVQTILTKLVMVSDARFSSILNDQLEVRTSVSINPATGAAEEGALFTSEAIPRSTVLHFQVTALNPAFFKVPRGEGPGVTLAKTMNQVHLDVWKGLDLIQHLGIGGVNTRGMGRLKVFPAIGD